MEILEYKLSNMCLLKPAAWSSKQLSNILLYFMCVFTMFNLWLFFMCSKVSMWVCLFESRISRKHHWFVIICPLFFSSLGKISQFSIIHECHEHLHKSWEPLVVGGLEHEFYLSIQLGIILIPTDFHSMIFQRGRRKTTNQILLTIINHIYICFHMLTVRYY